MSVELGLHFGVFIFPLCHSPSFGEWPPALTPPPRCLCSGELTQKKKEKDLKKMLKKMKKKKAEKKKRRHSSESSRGPVQLSEVWHCPHIHATHYSTSNTV